MKQQSVGILLCALLFTTFGHDVLNRHHLAHEAKHSYLQHAKAHHIAARDNANTTPSDCQQVCVEGGNLTISINGSIVIVADLTVNVALVIDIQQQLVAFVNGSSRAIIVISLTDSVGFYIENAFTGSLQVFLQGIVSLQVYVNKGVRFTASSITSVVQQQIISILASLGYYINVQLQETVGIVVQLLVSVRASLQVVVSAAASETFALRITLQALIERINGVAVYLRTVTVAGVRISIQRVLQLRSVVSLAAYLSVTFNSTIGTDAQSVFLFLAQLSGNSTSGINGAFFILGEYVALSNGNITYEFFVQRVLVFYLNNGVNGTSNGLVILQQEIDEFKVQANGTNSAALQILTQLVSGQLTVGGVKLIDLYRLLVVASAANLLAGVITFLFALQARFSIIVSAGILFVSFLRLVLAGSVGVVVLFVGELSGSLDINGLLNIIGRITGGILGGLISTLVTSLLVPFLLGSAYTLQILNAIVAAVRSSVNVSINVSAIFQQQQVVAVLVNFVQSIHIGGSGSVGFNVGGGVVVAAGK